MPVDVLIVEGNLDSEILAAVFKGTPVIRRGGSKNALKPQARCEREQNGVAAGYLRDRDFDYEPPDSFSVAVADSMHNRSTLGWRWARHEIENYLLDPAIVERATGVTIQEWSEALTDVASRISGYQIARWTVGQVRRGLPPHYELDTRPAELKNELQLPDSTEEGPSLKWCSALIREFATRTEGNMSEDTVEEFIDDRRALFHGRLLSDATKVLVWCSGKDLFAGLSNHALRSAGFSSAGGLRGALRDWVRENAEEAVHHLPEWQNLIEQVRA